MDCREKDMRVAEARFAEQDVAEQRHYYCCFGLRITSVIPFRELDPAPEGIPDLQIRFATDLDAELFSSASEAGASESQSRSKLMSFSSVGKFHVGPEAIIIQPNPGVRPEDLGLPLLGPVLATFLHQRDQLVLHASAILSKKGLIAFVGVSGAGKSTTAGWFATNVGPLFTDDLLPVSIAGGGRPLVRPGYPLVKLSSAALEAFEPRDAQILPVKIEGYPKLRVRLARPSVPAAGPIEHIFVLRRGAKAAYSALSKTDAFRAVMEHSYMGKYPDAFAGAARKVLHLQQCTTLARTVKVGELTVPSSLNRIHEVLPLLETI
jgi:hypothetical protein